MYCIRGIFGDFNLVVCKCVFDYQIKVIADVSYIFSYQCLNLLYLAYLVLKQLVKLIK